MVFLFFYRRSRWRLNWSPMVSCLLLLVMFSSCKKNEPSGDVPTVLQIFNGMDDGIGLVPIFKDAPPTSFASSRLLGRNAGFVLNINVFYVGHGVQPLRVYSWPDTLGHQLPLHNLQLDLAPQRIYSLFFSGNKTTPHYLLHQDNIPRPLNSDSVTHLRFVNLMEGQTVSVNLRGASVGSHVSQLAPQRVSDFVAFDARRSAGPYVFELRDLATETILTTYTVDKFNDKGFGGEYLNPWYNKSNTLVLTGKPGGTGQQLPQVSLMRHR